jgi:hypothetical protein
MDACARVGVEVSAARASGCAVVRVLARGAVRELGFGRLVPLFEEYVGRQGGLASPFGEYGRDTHPIAMLGREELCEVIHLRNRLGSLVITSNRQVEELATLFLGPSLASVTMGRLLDRAHQIVFEGDRDRNSPPAMWGRWCLLRSCRAWRLAVPGYCELGAEPKMAFGGLSNKHRAQLATSKRPRDFRCLTSTLSRR